MNEKLHSRKLWVYIITTILTTGSLIVSAITNNNVIADVSKIFAEGYVWIACLYLGANAAGKFVKKEGNDGQDIITR